MLILYVQLTAVVAYKSEYTAKRNAIQGRMNIDNSQPIRNAISILFI